jgi:MFS family permease
MQVGGVDARTTNIKADLNLTQF